MEEKRMSDRYTVDFRTGVQREQVFLYEFLDDNDSDGDTPIREGVATMYNISKNGCFVHCYEFLPLKTSMLITIIPVSLPKQKIIITGVIVRQKPDERYGFYYGIQFLECDDESEIILNKFLNQLNVAEKSRFYNSN